MKPASSGFSTSTKKAGGSSVGFQMAQQTGALNSDCFFNSMAVNPQIHALIDRVVAQNEDFSGLDEAMRNACVLKHKELIIDSLKEYQRKGNFVRIFPGKNSNMYD
mmetsp:Transcript_1254/g.786  ORF Transcript_1254/g.786 Transcript_1254/m.786 type:complete len:106 (+) Transcript_1254:524-841(+)